MALVNYNIFTWCYISNSVVLKREAVFTPRGCVAVSGEFVMSGDLLLASSG